jgi:hypothetical protein
MPLYIDNLTSGYDNNDLDSDDKNTIAMIILPPPPNAFATIDDNGLNS